MRLLYFSNRLTMKLRFLGVLGLMSLLLACSGPSFKGLTVSGTLSGAENMTVTVDRFTANGQYVPLADTLIASDGTFAMPISDSKPGDLLQLRIGNNTRIYLSNTGEELIEVTGELGKLRMFEYQVGASSPNNDAMKNVLNQLVTRQIQDEGINQYLESTADPVGAAFICMNTKQEPSLQHIAAYDKAIGQLQTQYPEAELINSLIQVKGQLVQQQQLAAQSPIQVGAPAPDITLENPNGKSYSLSDLKGQVVLLDFWASWCGPCRRENPNVVKVYEEYKDQGFTVFSVSLDGLDSRTKARYNGDEARIEAELEKSRQKWIAAIEKDGLPWEYHVSDLKKWESVAGRQYGVRSIPYTILIDRDGNIAAMKLRGAQMIETELKKII